MGESVAASGCDSSLLLVELASSPRPSPRSSSRWLELRIATPLPRAPLELSETLPRQPTLPLPRPTVTSLPTSGRRPSSPSLPTRSSQTSWRRTTALLVFRSRRLGPTSQLKIQGQWQIDEEDYLGFQSLLCRWPRALVPTTVNPE